MVQLLGDVTVEGEVVVDIESLILVTGCMVVVVLVVVGLVVVVVVVVVVAVVVVVVFFGGVTWPGL
jgi:hypothetical protein